MIEPHATPSPIDNDTVDKLEREFWQQIAAGVAADPVGYDPRVNARMTANFADLMLQHWRNRFLQNERKFPGMKIQTEAPE